MLRALTLCTALAQPALGPGPSDFRVSALLLREPFRKGGEGVFGRPQGSVRGDGIGEVMY